MWFAGRCDTYIELPVEKNELDARPGVRLDALPRASPATPAAFVTSPLFTLTTAISGAFSPLPNVFSVRWSASYAE